ncbi:thiamine-phosphate kinase [Microbacterium sp.]|uniref:thiamine-phosphate kinase n=1 Tax=Microbacterium sp. TaxID=51671 RepID=UPI003734F7A7
MDADLVGDVSEGELLRRVFAVLKGSSRALIGPGDDAAVLATPGGRVVATTDTLVHGPDFRLAWSSGYDLGYKAAAVNLSDVAAMGATPTALLVALAIPDDIPVPFVEELARGFRAGCDELAPGCAVEGGDLTVSRTLTVAVTALGVLEGDPVTRAGARAGDEVAVAGELGRAGRGLALLFERFRSPDGEPIPVDAASLSPEERLDLAAQLRPTPPVALGPVAARAGATAMMDVSDGLLLDAARLADASGVTLDLTADLSDLALTGGEDHALLATFGAGRVPEGFRVIGDAVERTAHPVTLRGAAPDRLGGWDPYRDWDAGTG